MTKRWPQTTYLFEKRFFSLPDLFFVSIPTVVLVLTTQTMTMTTMLWIVMWLTCIPNLVLLLVSKALAFFNWLLPSIIAALPVCFVAVVLFHLAFVVQTLLWRTPITTKRASLPADPWRPANKFFIPTCSSIRVANEDNNRWTSTALFANAPCASTQQLQNKNCVWSDCKTMVQNEFILSCGVTAIQIATFCCFFSHPALSLWFCACGCCFGPCCFVVGRSWSAAVHRWRRYAVRNGCLLNAICWRTISAPSAFSMRPSRAFCNVGL